MKPEDYRKYYIQGSDHYLIPKDEFEELYNEMQNWKEENEKQKEIIEKAIEYINSQKFYDLVYNPECPWDYGEVKKEILQILEDKEV